MLSKIHATWKALLKRGAALEKEMSALLLLDDDGNEVRPVEIGGTPEDEAAHVANAKKNKATMPSVMHKIEEEIGLANKTATSSRPKQNGVGTANTAGAKTVKKQMPIMRCPNNHEMVPCDVGKQVLCDLCSMTLPTTKSTRCAEQTNDTCDYDACADCVAHRREAFEIKMNVTTGFFAGNEAVGLFLLSRARITGSGEETSTGSADSFKLMMFQESQYAAQIPRKAIVHFKDGEAFKLEFTTATMTDPSNADLPKYLIGFNTLPPEGKAEDIPETAQPNYFWYKHPTQGVGYGPYVLNRVSCAAHELNEVRDPELEALEELVDGDVFRESHEMRNATLKTDKARRRQKHATTVLSAFDSETLFKKHANLLKGKELKDYIWKDTTATEPGKVSLRDIIYCTRLAQLAYLTEPIAFCDHFPLEREELLLSKTWRDRLAATDVKFEVKSAGDAKMLKDTAYQAYFIFHLVSLFNRNKDTPQYGMSLPIEQSMDAMNLQLYAGKPGNTNAKAQAGRYVYKHKAAFLAHSTDFDAQGGDIVIGFRGTVNVFDWLTDFDGIHVDYDPLNQGKPALDKAKVHRGFWLTFEAFRPMLQEALQDLLDRVSPDANVRIVLAGHSLGGALACLTMCWLLAWLGSHNDPTGPDADVMYKNSKTGAVGWPERVRIVCVTLGQPKVGNDVHSRWVIRHPRFSGTRAKVVNDVPADPAHPGRLVLTKGNMLDVISMPKDGEEGECIGVIGSTRGTFSKSDVNVTHAGEFRPRIKFFRLFQIDDPVPKLPPSGGKGGQSFDHLHRTCGAVDYHGDLVMFTLGNLADVVETSDNAVRLIMHHGVDYVKQRHDLNVYLMRVMQAAQNIYALDFQRIFGGVMNYANDARVTDFLEKF